MNGFYFRMSDHRRFIYISPTTTAQPGIFFTGVAVDFAPGMKC